MAATLTFTLVVMFIRIFGSRASIGGVSVFRIVSGSMEPAYSVGDYVVMKKVDTAKLKVDDVIAFISNDESIAGEIVVHRIRAIEDDGFVTGGDANPAEDYVKTAPERILGIVTTKIDILKTADGLFSKTEVFILLIALPILLMIVAETCLFVTKQSESRRIRAAITECGLDPEDKELFELVKRFGISSLAGIKTKKTEKEKSDEE